ncbi:MAG: hypothetical protein DMG48_01465 [Acidobacteria bacterium]|nr:MAG: hypothetical protein DMG48_01465 [Acidobacteriota bacterium]
MLPMTGFINPRGVLIALLILLAAGVTGFLFVLPSSASRFFGTALLAAGGFNVLLHRTFGRQAFDRTRSMQPFVANFWWFIGKERAQFLYLGIGTILAAAGLFLLTKSFF